MTNTAYKTRKLLSMLSCAEKEEGERRSDADA